MTTHRPLDISRLSDAERLLLAGELLDMAYASPAPLTAAQREEMERRDAEADARGIHGEPWEVVRQKHKPKA